ncbi:beta-ketoacyl synthase N-terminal-like domain-containing protein [Streptomyces sp. MS1.AVA.1]|uniref:Beta-ketoacyl synthase N-terminal-like domain-containing protein n=1 Tax=Streptomyces machairae TaxID=3134109 RepID=A0ABU8UQF1_9ACTN
MTTEEVPMQDLESAVAVVGMSGRFPGAPDLESYWANLRDGVCSLSTFTEKELLADGADAAELRNPAYVAAQGRLRTRTASRRTCSASAAPRRRPWTRSTGCCWRPPGPPWRTRATPR